MKEMKKKYLEKLRNQKDERGTEEFEDEKDEEESSGEIKKLERNNIKSFSQRVKETINTKKVCLGQNVC